MGNFIVNLYIKIFALVFGVMLIAGGLYSHFDNNIPTDKFMSFVVVGFLLSAISLLSIHRDIKKYFKNE